MTIIITPEDNQILWEETLKNTYVDSLDCNDITYPFSSIMGDGYSREIKLTRGLTIEILNCDITQHYLLKNNETARDNIIFHFHLFGYHQDLDTIVNNQEFALYGTGFVPQQINEVPPQKVLEVNIHVDTERLISYIGSKDGELPKPLHNFIKPLTRQSYACVGKVTPMLEGILWQILRCPFQGITKRIYLEAKALELIGLVIAEQIEALSQESCYPKSSIEQCRCTIARIHSAKSILLANLHQPPSIAELARQVQLNEYTLKQGFKEVFKTTIFDYLRNYRLQQAKQLLETGQMGVKEVMNAVGYCDRHHFAMAFRKKFNVNPRDYLKGYRF
ncbi:helix-turn-helix domain-containing protein [Cyanobacterium aponinum]|uniref:Transcriptional regulator, AraC family n=1 Tax=Cyanobacterium aponinum (strain PCC 10605) TaxID=755178 RepID=K9Z5V9_CYAAP|nr:AraC family transcriptional regulator [Cyanobacterium aponinum]AFZ54127.1 transcriptional regulator, AraC family [Cyanobacterium aponinum PCC 10605]